MNPARPSEAQEFCGKGDAQRSETPGEFGQAASVPESMAGSRRACEIEPSGLACEEKKRYVEKDASETRDKGLETVPMKHSQPGDILALDVLAGLQWPVEDLMKMRPLNEDQGKARELSTFGISAYNRFVRTGNVGELDTAIKNWGVAVALLRSSQTESWGILSNLGCAYWSRFECLGEALDLESAIKCGAGAVSLTPDGHPDKPGYLNNLGNAYLSRFERLGELSDLSKAVESREQAVSLTPDGHPAKSTYLTNLGGSYQTRFRCLGELSDLNKAVESKAQSVSLTPDGHPNKPGYLSNLGISYLARFERLSELRDLNKAVESQAQAVLFTPDGHPDKPRILTNLGNSYLTRFERLGELPDLNKAVESQAQAAPLTPDGHPNKPSYLSNLGNSYLTRFKQIGELPDLNKAVESQAQAVSLAPDDHPNKPGYLNNLGDSYRARFGRLGKLLDLNKAIEYQAQATLLTPDGHPDKPLYLNNSAESYRTRFERLGELSDLNKAVESQAQAVLLTPDGHSEKPGRLSNLGNSYLARFKRLGELSDLNKAVESQAQVVSLTTDGHPNNPGYLNNLGLSYWTRFESLRELSDLNKAIESQTHAVSLTPDGHPNKSGRLTTLGNSYRSRFKCLGELSDLSKAVESQAQAVLLTPDGHPDKPACLINLGFSHVDRFTCLSDSSDLQSAASLFKRAAQSPTGPPSIRFDACKRWARLSRGNTTLSPLPAYQQAMALIPQLVWIGTTIGRRYELVVEASTFAAEAASYAISTGAHDIALEWIEAGRSIVWGQISQLRSPFDYLARHNPELANELASIGRQLEHAGSRTSLLSAPPAGSPDLGQEANVHISLALKWDRLLMEIREIPGFEDFLRAPRASQLLSAAKAHPIAVINLHESRCDALILNPGGDTISHVALTDFSPKNALLARHDLISHMRDRRPRPRLNPMVSIHDSLEGIWFSVIKPVLDFLGYTHKMPVDQLPQLTWCTSGLLSFIPLHAARSRDESLPSTFDLVISSYTPTLSALLSTESADSTSNCGIVAVGQENTPGLNSLPCTTTELAVIRKHTRSEQYLQLEKDEATVEQVLDAMDQFSWVHMACHGSQDPHDPTKSAFHLHDGDLTLADITKRSFTNKGLAFLSACQTATGDENMPDEALHLAAGLLTAGYPSVIGTMWSIADEDGPEVADQVYAELLKDGKMDHTKSARALHGAVAQLRARVGAENIGRWAPFIHLGL